MNRHGKYIDWITVDRGRKPVSSDPIEIGRAAIAKVKAVGYEALEIDRIEPATVGGLPGFVADLHFMGYFADDAKLPFRRRLYGVANKDGVYLLTLNAASAIYFDEDLPAFESLVSSLKLGMIKVYPAGKKPKD